MSRISQSAVLAVPIAVALVLAGCSSGSPGKQDADELGPLSKYLSVLDEGQAMTQEKLDKQQAEVEDMVAACMQKEGFEYIPNTQTWGAAIVGAGDEDGPQYGTKDFAEQYGYGIIDSPWNSSGPEDPTKVPTDPNEAYINSLSESERQAFQEALYGPPQTFDDQDQQTEESGSVSVATNASGCYGKAQEKVFSQSSPGAEAYSDPEFQDLWEKINKAWNQIIDAQDTDPAIKELNTAWANCMADANYPDLTNPMNASSVIMDEMNSLYGDSSGSSNPDENLPAKEPSKKELDDLKKREIKMATTDFSCQEKVDYKKKTKAITDKIEQKILDENRTQLDAMIAKYAPGKKKEK